MDVAHLDDGAHVDVSSFRLVAHAGAPCPDPVRRRAHDLATKSLTDTLMAQANAENWKLALQTRRNLETNTCQVGVARPWRYHDTLGRHGEYFINTYSVIAAHDNVGPDLTHIVAKVVDETIVVIDE